MSARSIVVRVITREVALHVSMPRAAASIASSFGVPELRRFSDVRLRTK
jgi:hypothetical protein